MLISQENTLNFFRKQVVHILKKSNVTQNNNLRIRRHDNKHRYP